MSSYHTEVMSNQGWGRKVPCWHFSDIETARSNVRFLTSFGHQREGAQTSPKMLTYLGVSALAGGGRLGYSANTAGKTRLSVLVPDSVGTSPGTENEAPSRVPGASYA
jgi:hypothetical protein